MKGFIAVLIPKNASATTKSESEYALSRVSPQDIEPDAEQEPPIFAVNTLTNFQEGEKKNGIKARNSKRSRTLCFTTNSYQRDGLLKDPVYLTTSRTIGTTEMNLQ